MLSLSPKYIWNVIYLYFFAVSNTAFARSSAPQAPKMALDGVVDIVSNQIAANSNLIATSVGDNLGYTFPIVGILSLAAFILYLSPPLADE